MLTSLAEQYGRRIPECGVFESLPSGSYHDLFALNASSLKAGLLRDGVSPKHMLAALSGQMKSESDAMRFGTAAHTVVFEGWQAFMRDVLVQGPCQGIKKDGDRCQVARGTWHFDGLWYCKTHAPAGASQPDNIVESDSIDRLTSICDAIDGSDAADLIRSPARNELTCVWDMDGVRMKARLDRFERNVPDRPFPGSPDRYGDGATVTDLKSAEPGKVDRHSVMESIKRYGWHIQCAVYLEAAVHCLDACPMFRWVFVEKRPPHDVAVWYASENMIEWGQRDLKRLREGFRDAMQTGLWQGAGPVAGETNEIDPPEYIRAELNSVGPITLGGNVVMGG